MVLSLTQNSLQALIERIQFILYTQRFRCENNATSSGCFNTEMYIKVTYFCNDCGSES
jgi:hypothetical protein